MIATACGCAIAGNGQSLDSGSVRQAVARLKPGEYLWMPQAAPEGPMILIVNVRTQRAVLYRNGLPIAITTVSTGRKSHKTPLGVFTILEKEAVHFSSIYDSAPMPHMQRLTWGGVALHGGHLPGYPASHGCIRLPHEFARLLFDETRLGMTVIVTDRPSAPVLALGIELAAGTDDATFMWKPEAAPTGPVSILVSSAEQRVVVLRNGKLIGSARLSIEGKVDRPQLFALVRAPSARLEWARIPLPGQAPDSSAGTVKIISPPDFRALVEQVLVPGATVVVTPDKLKLGSIEPALLEADKQPTRRN
ncbi:L,D-transpeptidase family protein [Sphingomonas sp. MS122]|uniref:L,D-transpeptidase family protein n=1 Tax=Sphingomonas sp. MS122 TaxID=3412683 RepID=UPI003C301CF8